MFYSLPISINFIQEINYVYNIVFNIKLQVFVLVLLVASSQATFKKRKQGNKGEDAAALGSSHGGGGHGKGSPHGGGPYGGDYQNGGGYPNDHRHGHRREPHGEGYRGEHSHGGGYRGGDHDDYDGYRKEPSHDDPRRGHHNEGYRGGPPHGAGGFRREHDEYRGEPSNHGYRGDHVRNFHSGGPIRGGPQIPGYRHGGGGLGNPNGFRGGAGNDDDEKRRYGPGGAEYEDSEEEDAALSQGWIGLQGTSSSDGSTKANETEGSGTGRLGSFFSRTKSGIKRLLKLS